MYKIIIYLRCVTLIQIALSRLQYASLFSKRDFGYFMGNVIWAQKSVKERKYMGKIHYMKD